MMDAIILPILNLSPVFVLVSIILLFIKPARKLGIKLVILSVLILIGSSVYLYVNKDRIYNDINNKTKQLGLLNGQYNHIVETTPDHDLASARQVISTWGFHITPEDLQQMARNVGE